MRVRGFEFVKDSFFKDFKDGYEYRLPLRSTKNSSAYDFFAPREYTIFPNDQILIWTNVKAYMLPDEFLQIHVRSSVGIKKGLVLANVTGIIDSDYYSNPDNDGNIAICLYNRGNQGVKIKQGEKIAQGIFMKYLIADNCNSNVERTGGIGSTGEVTHE